MSPLSHLSTSSHLCWLCHSICTRLTMSQTVVYRVAGCPQGWYHHTMNLSYWLLCLSVADSPQQMMTRPVWVPDAVAKECMVCHIKFSTFVRKHHCRRCGRVVCSSCSPHHVSLAAVDSSMTGQTPPSGEQGKLERVCKECFKEMTAQHNRCKGNTLVVKDSDLLLPIFISKLPVTSGKRLRSDRKSW